MQSENLRIQQLEQANRKLAAELQDTRVQRLNAMNRNNYIQN